MDFTFLVVHYCQACTLAIPGQNGVIWIYLIFSGSHSILQQHFTVHKIGVEYNTVFTLFKFYHSICKAARHWVGIKMNKVLFANFFGN